MNLYWPVYKNLEKEVLSLADYIHFSDDQIKIYSLHIADLIVRCAVEIEALSKELYSQLGGNMTPVDGNGNARDLYFDTDCLDLLEQNWHISKKQITISAFNFYFNDASNKVLTPLHKANKRGLSGSKWKQAYQALKHDRNNSLKQASIINLLHALGALYILNLYYKNEQIDIGRVYLGDHSFDSRVGSSIFSVCYCSATGLSMSAHFDDSCISLPLGTDLDKAIYIVKYDDKSIREMHRDFCLDNEITLERFRNSTEIKKFLEEHPEYDTKDKSINRICLDAGGVSLFERIICLQHTRQNKSSREEAIINKHSGIYPELFPVSEK